MKIPKSLLYSTYLLNLILVAALVDYAVYSSKSSFHFKQPEEVFPVVLIQKTDSELRALNLFNKEVFLDGLVLGPAQIKNNQVTTTPIIRTPLKISWDNKLATFPTDFAKEAPTVISLRETPLCNICQKTRGKWIVKKGIHFVSEMIIVPANLQLEIESGAILNFSDEAGIFSRSPLIANNSIFQGKRWKGITVLNQSLNKSILKDCLIEGGTGFEIFGMKYTGTLNFILGEIDLLNLKFQNSQSEDALNIKWVSGNITNIIFLNSLSDALDIDWSNMELNQIKVDVTGNDCLDLSGGNVSLNQVQLNRCGDKGISNGENNNLKVRGLEISQTKTAIANKDGAKMNLEDVLVSNSEVAYHQYHHKVFYEEPIGHFNHEVKFEQVSTTLKIEAGKVSGHESL